MSVMNKYTLSTAYVRTSGVLGLISVPAVTLSAEAVKNDTAAREVFLADLAVEIKEAEARHAVALRRFNRVNTVNAGKAVNRAAERLSILERAARIAAAK